MQHTSYYNTTQRTSLPTQGGTKERNTHCSWHTYTRNRNGTHMTHTWHGTQRTHSQSKYLGIGRLVPPGRVRTFLQQHERGEEEEGERPERGHRHEGQALAAAPGGC